MVLIRISNSLGNQLKLAQFGFQFDRVVGKDGKVKKGWYGKLGEIDFSGLIAEFPPLASLFNRFV